MGHSVLKKGNICYGKRSFRIQLRFPSKAVFFSTTRRQNYVLTYLLTLESRSKQSQMDYFLFAYLLVTIVLQCWVNSRFAGRSIPTGQNKRTNTKPRQRRKHRHSRHRYRLTGAACSTVWDNIGTLSLRLTFLFYYCKIITENLLMQKMCKHSFLWPKSLNIFKYILYILTVWRDDCYSFTMI